MITYFSRGRVLLPALLALSPATRLGAQDVGADTVAATPVPAGIIVRTDLAYAEHPRQQLDLYLPFGHPAQPRPLIVYLHGGGWKKGGKADGRRLALRFVAQGYAVACVNYRLSSDALYPAQIEDCKAAVRWLRANAENYSIDPDHVGAIGVSAGGHLAALLGALNSSGLYEVGAAMDQSSHVQAVCDFFGPVDLVRLFDAARPDHSPQATEVVELLGGDPHRQAVAARSANPTQFIDRVTCPFLIIHGDRDTTVSLDQSRLLYDALIAKHILAHLHIVNGAGHTGPAFVTPAVDALVDDFFSRTLALPGARESDLPPSGITESNKASAKPPPP